MNGQANGMFRSENIKLDSACSLFSEEHQIPHRIAALFEEIDALLQEHDPGCEVTIGAAGCGGCVDESCDYAVFYVAQDPRKETHLMLKYDTGVHEEDRDPALSRKDLGALIAEVADRENVPWSWNGSAAKCVCVGKDDAYDTRYSLDDE